MTPSEGIHSEHDIGVKTLVQQSVVENHLEGGAVYDDFSGIKLRRDPANNFEIQTPEEHEEPATVKDKIRRVFQEASPSWLVNNAVRANSAFRMAGDWFNYKSSQKAGSVYRGRAAMISAVGGVTSFFFPQHEQSQDTIDAYDRMSLPEYATTRVGQIFQPWNHITQTIGASIALNGLFTLQSGMHFLSTSKDAAELKIPYVKETFPLRKGMLESTRGLWTLAGAGGLIFAKNEANAWQWFSSFMTARTGITIAQGFESHKFDKDQYMGFSVASNLTANGVGFLYGGGKKYPDGTIVEVQKRGAEKEATIEESILEPSKQVTAHDAELTQHKHEVLERV